MYYVSKKGNWINVVCCFHKKYDVKNHTHILGYGVWHKQQFSDKNINERFFFSGLLHRCPNPQENKTKDWYL